MTAIADRVSLAYVEESTFGVTPSGPPTLQDLRFVSENFHEEQDSQESAEIRDDRQTADVPRTAVRALGSVNHELTYGTYDDFLVGALAATGADASAAWSTVVTVGPISTISSTAGTDSYTLSDSGSGFGSLLAKQWVKIEGFTGVDAVMNGYAKIVTASPSAIVVSGNGDGTTATAGDTITITMGAQIVNGGTDRSWSIEREYTDLSNTFAVYTGMTVDTANLQIQARAIVTGNFGFVGTGESDNTATVGDGSNDAGNVNGVMTGSEDVIQVVENGEVISANQLTLDISNNIRQRAILGLLTPESLGLGKFGLTGTAQMYFATSDIMQAYLDNTDRSLAAVIEDDDGQAYVFEMPRIKYTTGERVAGGVNTDIIANMNWTAYRHGVEGITMRIARFA